MFGCFAGVSLGRSEGSLLLGAASGAPARSAERSSGDAPVDRFPAPAADCCLAFEQPRCRRSESGRSNASQSTTASIESERRCSDAESVCSEAESEQEEASREIRSTSEAGFFKRYSLGQHVMKTGNAGVSVRFGTRRCDEQEVVIKVLNKDMAFGGGGEQGWRQTMEAQLRMPKSEVICDLTEIVETDRRYYVVMEKVEGKDLCAWENNSQARFRLDATRQVARQLLQAVQAMHNSGRIHRDLKLENLMVDVSPNGQVSAKLIDFDTAEAREDAPRATHVIGTGTYVAPEAFGGRYSPASDMYAVGVIMYKMLTHEFPVCPKAFEISGDARVEGPAMKKLQKKLSGVRVNFSLPSFAACPAAAELCRVLLSADPDRRLTAEEALEHDWFHPGRVAKCTDTLSSPRQSPSPRRSASPRECIQRRVRQDVKGLKGLRRR